VISKKIYEFLVDYFGEEHRERIWTVVFTLLDLFIVGATLLVIYVAVRHWL